MGANVIAAPSRAEAEYIASSHQAWVANLYAGHPGPLPRPVEGYMKQISDRDRYSLGDAMACSVVGDPQDVGSWLYQFIETTQADEVIIDARIYDPAARCRSYALAAESIADILT